jgi:hypothetical protein
MKPEKSLSGAQALAPFLAAAGKNLPSALGSHSTAKPDSTFPFGF